MQSHLSDALVEDKPGVLNRVASLFRRRNFNIEVADGRAHRTARRLAHDRRGGLQPDATWSA